MSTNLELFSDYLKSIGVTKIPMLLEVDNGASFAAFLSFSVSDGQPFTQMFLDETGAVTPSIKRDALSQMVDKACGYDPKEAYKEHMAKYIDWLIVNHWGEEGVEAAA